MRFFMLKSDHPHQIPDVANQKNDQQHQQDRDEAMQSLVHCRPTVNRNSSAMDFSALSSL